LFGLVIASVLGVAYLAVRSANELHRFRSDDPAVWEPAVAALESSIDPATDPGVVFLGASTVRFWSTIDEDLAPVAAVARGFGGAKAIDLQHYWHRLLGANPKVVVLVAGTNDFFKTGGNIVLEPENFVAIMGDTARAILAAHPQARLYFVAMRPSVRSPEGDDPFSVANGLLRDFAEAEAGIDFIDPTAGLYLEDGKLNPAFRDPDRSQLNRDGYRVWSAPIRDRLVRDLAS